MILFLQNNCCKIIVHKSTFSGEIAFNTYPFEKVWSFCNIKPHKLKKKTHSRGQWLLNPLLRWKIKDKSIFAKKISSWGPQMIFFSCLTFKQLELFSNCKPSHTSPKGALLSSAHSEINDTDDITALECRSCEAAVDKHSKKQTLDKRLHRG